MSSGGTSEKGRIALAEGAPQVELGALVLENHGLAILEEHSTMGRVIIATEALDTSLLYQPVLRELPALVCKQQDYVDFMEQFLDAPVELQVGILDMFYQPLDSAMGKALFEPAKTLYMLEALEDMTVIHQLLSIFMTNGHQYRGNHSAIPLFGSKFAHSCAPNIGYSSIAAEDGALEYKLLRPVAEGELVCFSYLSDLLETPTNERRQLLMNTKTFWCACDRCNGPDFCRCMPCPNCSARIPCQYPEQSYEAYWECSKCGMLETDPIAGVERAIGKTLETINRTIEQRNNFEIDNSEYSPQILQELVSKCQSELSETHHLTVKALRLLFLTASGHAFVQIKKMMARGWSIASPKIHALFRTSVVAGFQLVLAGECVAADCTGCQFPDSRTNKGDTGILLQPNHEPNYDRAMVVRHVCDNLLRIPVFWWPPQAFAMTKRYLPIMKARFGEMIVPIEIRVVRAWNEATCFDCGTYWDAYTAATIPQPMEANISSSETTSNGPTTQIPSKAQQSQAKAGNSNKKKNNKKKKRRK